MQPPRRASNPEDPLKALEAEAYQAAEDSATSEPYHGKDGPPAYVKPYRPEILREWPIYTNFRPDELSAKEVGRD